MNMAEWTFTMKPKLLPETSDQNLRNSAVRMKRMEIRSQSLIDKHIWNTRESLCKYSLCQIIAHILGIVL